MSDKTTAPGFPGERHLGEVLDALRAHVWLLLAVTVGAAVVAGGLSLLQAPQYRATALVLVSGSKVPTGATGESARPDSQLFAETFATLLRSRQVAQDVVEQEKIPGFSADSLSGGIRVQPVAGTMLLRVSLDAPDPAVAVRLVNAQTARVVSLNREMGTADLSDTREYLREQVADAARTLADREQQLAKARATLQVQELTKRLEGSLEQRAELDKVLHERAQEEGRYGAEAAGYREALTAQRKTVVLNRSLAEDTSALPDAAALASGGSREQLLGLQLRTEVINPVFEQGEPLLLKAQAQEKGALAELASVRTQIVTLDKELVELQNQLGTRRRTLDAAEREYELAKASYEAFAKSYENARLSVAAQGAEMRVVEPATASTARVSPRPLLSALSAGIGAALIGIFAVLVQVYIREDRGAASP